MRVRLTPLEKVIAVQVDGQDIGHIPQNDQMTEMLGGKTRTYEGTLDPETGALTLGEEGHAPEVA